MIVIDEFADVKLVKTLEHLREAPDNTRCVYFNMMTKPSVEGIRDKIIRSTQEHIPVDNTQIYLCEDGDIFILAPNLPSKEAKRIMLDVASYAELPLTNDFADLYEVNLHANKLLVTLEQKLEKRRKEKEALEKQHEQKQVERKRNSILNEQMVGDARSIAAIRSNRTSPQLMIIEDDAFSRKLVENVLQKQYPLTALATADLALNIYSRLAPDLLFLDINLPDVTGHELLEKIMALDPKAYVIMLSGNSDKDNILQAITRGAKGFIAKPFTRDKLFQYIERCPTIK